MGHSSHYGARHFPFFLFGSGLPCYFSPLATSTLAHADGCVQGGLSGYYGTDWALFTAALRGNRRDDPFPLDGPSRSSMALGCWGRRVLGVYVCRVSLKPLLTWHPCAIGPPLSPPMCGPPFTKDGSGCCPKPPWASGGPGEDTGGVLSGAACDAYSPACAIHAEGGVACGPAIDAAAERHCCAALLFCCSPLCFCAVPFCGDYGRICLSAVCVFVCLLFVRPLAELTESRRDLAHDGSV